MDKRLLETYPRPTLKREAYTSLNGPWDFAFDDQNEGEALHYEHGFSPTSRINVPFPYQAKDSGLGLDSRHDEVWYQRTIEWKDPSKRLLLHLEGADYEVKVYLNGILVGHDSGAYHRMTFDLTPYAKPGENLLVIHCHDDYSVEKPRGKQRYEDKNFACWYRDTTGIYKDVWLEEVSPSYVEQIHSTPLYEENAVRISLKGRELLGKEAHIVCSYLGEKLAEALGAFEGDSLTLTLPLSKRVLWEEGKGGLIDVHVEIRDEQGTLDRFESYFGMRKVEAKDGKVYLNGKPLYQKLILDQGYFDQDGLTAPSPKALLNDLLLAKELGYNGARKHQHLADERTLYYADVLGFLIWSEMPSMYKFTENSAKTFERELDLFLEQQYNHPSILTWVIFNESWGIGEVATDKTEQAYVLRLYKKVKAFDPTRFAISNDGWEHVKSDLITIHHYEQDPAKLKEIFRTKENALNDKWEWRGKGAFAEGCVYHGEPLLLTEYGGTAYDKAAKDGAWGYGASVKGDEDFLARFGGLLDTIHSLEYFDGYCYTQLTDVEQEVNGLLHYDRTPKVDPKAIKKLQDR